MAASRVATLLLVAVAVAVAAIVIAAATPARATGTAERAVVWLGGAPVVLVPSAATEPLATGLQRSPGELAVFFDAGAVVTPATMAAVARDLGAVGPLPGSSEFVMFVRLPDGGAGAAARSVEGSDAPGGVVAAVAPVYRRSGAGSTERVAPTGDLVVTCDSAATLRDVGRSLASGLAARLSPLRGAPRSGLLRAPSPVAALDAARELSREPGVVSVTLDCYRPRAARAVPDDPLFSSQWHLSDPGPGVDLNVVPAWDAVRGSASEVIAIVDDGVELTHADLAGNVAAGSSWDYVGGDADPAPGFLDDHGTACAGVAAARGFNGRGVSGTAPRARLAGIRLLGATTDVREAAALSRLRGTIDIYSCSWGPEDDRHLERPGPLTEAALAGGVVEGRGGRGSVFVWAGGNGRAYDDDANFDGYANSRFVAAVAACDRNGVQASYSERGANLLVTAPSSGSGAGITTVDRSGSPGYSSGAYTSSFGGTSAAAPAVAGVAALMLQANPDLTWRDVQAILAESAVKNDPGDPEWTQNGAGRWVSHRYGFGLVDAAAAVAAAATWTTLGPQAHGQGSAAPGAAVPDNDGTGIVSQITIADDISVETAEVVLEAPHAEWSDLRVELVSPSGTVSVLASPADGGSGAGFSGWRFMTRRCYGESSAGPWTLRVSDRSFGQTGTFASWALTVHGRPNGAWVDDTAPYTTVLGAAGWHRTPATATFSVFDPDSPVASTESRLDGGPWTAGASASIAAPADHGNDGHHMLEYRSVDVNGQTEATRSTDVAIDTRGPDARAPRRASVRRGATAALAYRVNDALSPKADVTIRVRTLGGRIVKTVRLSRRPTNVSLSYRFACRLAPGTYRFAVTARDLAGNRQVHVGSNRLVVR